MVDYDFYAREYLGEAISETEFPRYAKRADELLHTLKTVYGATPREGIRAAEECAACAVAEAMYEFGREDARRGLASASVGSVRETYTEPPELSATTLSLRRHYYYEVAKDYLQMYRGVRDA